MQTRAPARTPEETAIVREAGTAAAYRRTAGLLLAVELLLWACTSGIVLAGRSLWLAVLALVPMGLVVWWASRQVWEKPPLPARSAAKTDLSRPWESLLLWPCLLLDAIWLLNALLCLLHALMPSYPAGILRVVIPLLLTASVLLGRRNGAAYGVNLWRWLLPLMAVWVLANVLRDHGLALLHPLLGTGWKTTAKAAACGLGALWPIGLLFLLPQGGGALRKPATGKAYHTLQYAFLPLALGCLCALALGCCGAWVEQASVGQRLLMAGRSGGSMLLSALWALFWLLGLMCGFITLLMAAAKLVQPLFPQLPAYLPPMVTALPAALLLWVWTDGLPPWVLHLLPWRLAFWLAALLLGLWRRRSRPQASSTSTS